MPVLPRLRTRAVSLFFLLALLQAVARATPPPPHGQPHQPQQLQQQERQLDSETHVPTVHVRLQDPTPLSWAPVVIVSSVVGAFLVFLTCFMLEAGRRAKRTQPDSQQDPS